MMTSTFEITLRIYACHQFGVPLLIWDSLRGAGHSIDSWQAQSMLQSKYYAYIRECSAKVLEENPSMSKRKALDEARKM